MHGTSSMWNLNARDRKRNVEGKKEKGTEGRKEGRNKWRQGKERMKGKEGKFNSETESRKVIVRRGDSGGNKERLLKGSTHSVMTWINCEDLMYNMMTIVDNIILYS